KSDRTDEAQFGGSVPRGPALAPDATHDVGLEAVLDPPQHRLRAALDADLAVRRTDVGLHRVDAQVAAVGDLLVGEPLGDQGDDLRLADGEAVLLARPGGLGLGADRAAADREDSFTGVDPLDGVDE